MTEDVEDILAELDGDGDITDKALGKYGRKGIKNSDSLKGSGALVSALKQVCTRVCFVLFERNSDWVVRFETELQS